MVKVIVYGREKDVSTQRVLILLEELELKYDFEEVKEGDTEKSDIFGNVPLVMYGETVLFESRAIMRYIARNNKEIHDFNDNTKVDIFMEVEANEFAPVVSKIVKKDKDYSLKEFEIVLDKYNKILEDQSFIAGDTYSIADMTHIPYAYNVLKCGHKDILKQRMNVYNWLKRIMKRPVVKRVLECQINV